MAATASTRFVDQMMPVTAPNTARRAIWEPEADLVRRSVRALYVTGTFLDLPEESQLHPALQERMVAYAPELDDTVYDVLDALRELPEERRRHVRTTLRSRPDLPLDIAASINTLAKATDMSRTRRAQVRSSLTQAGWRLGKQNPSLVIDEYVKKIDKFAPRDASDAELLRRYQTIVGQAALQRAQGHALHVQTPGVQAPGAGAPDPRVAVVSTTPSFDVEVATPGERNRRRGAKAMGLGLLMFGGGALIISLGTYAGVFAVTAGVTMFGIGLVTFFAGLIQE